MLSRMALADEESAMLMVPPLDELCCAACATPATATPAAEQVLSQ